MLARGVLPSAFLDDARISLVSPSVPRLPFFSASYLFIRRSGTHTDDASTEVTEGMRFDRGGISPYFVTDVKSHKVEFERPLILLSKKISLLQDVLPDLEPAAE